MFYCVTPIYLSELRSSTVRVILLHLSNDVVNLSSKRIFSFSFCLYVMGDLE